MDPAWKRAREYMGVDLDAAEYARRTDQSPQAVSKWENGSRMSRDKVEEVARKLGLSAHYLLFGEEYEDNGPSRPSIVCQLQKLIGWARGEAVDWEPDPIPDTRKGNRVNGGGGGTGTEDP